MTIVKSNVTVLEFGMS